MRSDCKPDAETKSLLDNLYFELYYIKSYVDLLDKNLKGKSPIKYKSDYL